MLDELFILGVPNHGHCRFRVLLGFAWGMIRRCLVVLLVEETFAR